MPGGEFVQGWFGRYCVPGLERVVEWCGPYKTRGEVFDSLDTEYGSRCHGWGGVIKKALAEKVVEHCDHYGLGDGCISPKLRSLNTGRIEIVLPMTHQEASQYQTYSEHEAATAFVRSHRLSIANAFERKIVRGDVVAELVRRFEAEPKHALRSAEKREA